MRIKTCIGEFEVPKVVVNHVKDFIMDVLDMVLAQGCGHLIYFPTQIYESRISIETVSTTLLYKLNLLISLIAASNPEDGQRFLGYTARAINSSLDLVLAINSITKVVTESCIAIKTMFGWVACCDDSKHVSRILRRELHEVEKHLLAEDPEVEEKVREFIAQAKSVKDLFTALVSHPSIALAIGALLPLYLPPHYIEVEVKELNGYTIAKANTLSLAVVMDPSVACRDGNRKELGKFFTEVALHEYLHLALYANAFFDRGTWLFGKPIGIERIIVEIVKNLVNTVPLKIVRGIGEKLRELIPASACQERKHRALYTDLTYVVIAENADLVEELLLNRDLD